MIRSSASVPLTVQGRTAFDAAVQQAQRQPLHGIDIETVQVNIGLRCNLACRHCHVQSSPNRDEQMTWRTMQDVLIAAERANAQTLDITGGAPEMHPQFRRLVDEALARRLHVMVRTNLTIMLEPGYGDLPHFLADRGVYLVASLPCYLPNNVDRQRGRRVYDDSVEVIQRLNHVGYGTHANKRLDLIYNPLGADLPPDQQKLEDVYRLELFQRFGIYFDRLYAITNVAIGRFLRDLEREGEAVAYQQLLRDAFNPAALDGLMCRHQLHVGHDGTMYDCDFNYALKLPAEGPARHVRDFDPESFARRRIGTGEHCFACTAGRGSSCSGALT